MPRPRNVAAMTAQEFVEAVAMSGRKYNELAVTLGKSASIMSKYATGRVPVPEPIRAKLQELIEEREKFLKTSGWLQPGQDVAAANAALRQATQATAPRLYLVKRRSTITPRQYPPYRFTHEKLLLFVDCIKRYLAFVRGERQAADNTQRVADLDAEIKDVILLARQAADLVHSTPPYNFHINSLEWYVVSRILRHGYEHHGMVWARSMYQHWRKHKGLYYVSHGKYSWRDPAEKRDENTTHPTGGAVPAISGAGEGTGGAGHLAGGADPEHEAGANPDRPRSLEEVIVPVRGSEHEIATIITAGGNRGVDYDNAKNNRRTDGRDARNRHHDAGYAQQECPACGAGPQDDCRPGCALA